MVFFVKYQGSNSPLATRLRMLHTKKMTPDDIRQELELKIVELLRDKVDNEEMSEERRQQIAKIVLELIKPGMNLEELYRAIPKLDDMCQELAPVVLPYLRDYEQGVTKRAQVKIQELIDQGQYDQAVNLAESVIHQKVKLVWYGKGKN